MLPDLDPLLHSQLRLQVMSLLISLESADFTYLLEETGASRGNISVQINKLKDAGYIEVKKAFGESYPVTTCKITDKGIKAFETYVDALEKYIQATKKK